MSTNHCRVFVYETYHLFPKKFKPLKRAHGLRTSLDIFENNVGLTAHFFGLHGHNVQNNAVGGKKCVKREP